MRLPSLPASKGLGNILWSTAVAAFLAPYLGSSLNVALPTIGKEFQASPLQLSWLAAVFLATAAAGLIPAGVAADAWGRRRLFTFGLAGQGVFAAGAAFAPTWGVLMALRAAQGLFAATTFATGVALLTGSAPKGQLGKLLGLNTGAVYLGLFLGPPVGGLFTEHLGWRYIFASGAVLAVSGALLMAKTNLIDRPQPRHLRWWKPTIFFVGALATMIGLLLGRTLPEARLWAAAGTLIVMLCIFWPQGGELFSRELLRNRAFAFSNLAAFLYYAATFSVSFYLAIGLQVARNWSPSQTGWLLLLQPLAMTLLSPPAGALSDTREPRWLASGGMALSFLGLAMLTGFSGHISTFSIALSLFLLGVGFAFFSAPNTNTVMSQARPDELAEASAILATMRLTGQALSLVIASLLLPAGGRAAITIQALESSLAKGFTLSSFLCALGVPFSLARGSIYPGKIGES